MRLAVDQDTPVIVGGVLNFDVLVADGADAYAGAEAKAFADSEQQHRDPEALLRATGSGAGILGAKWPESRKEQ
jgi:hypothetical protein